MITVNDSYAYKKGDIIKFTMYATVNTTISSATGVPFFRFNGLFPTQKGEIDGVVIIDGTTFPILLIDENGYIHQGVTSSIAKGKTLGFVGSFVCKI